jgi:hypothetical protein
VTRTTTTRPIAEQSPNLNSRKRFALKPKLDTERCLWPLYILFEEINALKRPLQLKPEMTATSKKRKAESLLSTGINSTCGITIVFLKEPRTLISPQKP